MRRALVAVAALAIGASGVIGVLHAGVEYRWWPGFTACTSLLRPSGSTAAMLDQILRAPVVRCDVPQWSLFGVSLAGFNAIFSLVGAVAILVLLTRRTR